MTAPVTIDRPSVAKRSRKPVTVSASALAQHPDCSRIYIGKLEADEVIQRLPETDLDFGKGARFERKASIHQGKSPAAFLCGERYPSSVQGLLLGLS